MKPMGLGSSVTVAEVPAADVPAAAVLAAAVPAVPAALDPTASAATAGAFFESHTAIPKTAALTATPTQTVAFRPSAGRRKKAAAIVPPTAPAVFVA